MKLKLMVLPHNDRFTTLRCCLKRITVLLIALMVAITTSLSTMAVNLGTLDYWESDSNIISRWNTQRKIYIVNLSSDSDSSFNLSSYVSYAVYQWSTNAGIAMNTAGTSSSHSIIIYGGSASELIDAGVFNDFNTANGKTSSTATVEGTYTYNNTTKTGKVTTYSKIAIVRRDNRTSMGYCKTTAHELGHALGWAGHSTTYGDIMYTRSSNNETGSLTANDIRHLMQVY